jgi:NitT/TauT family transport system substrate-binding protein
MIGVRRFAIVLSMVALASCRGSEPASTSTPVPAAPPGTAAKPLTVAIPTYPGFALPYLAQQKNLFGATKVDLKRIDDAAAINAGLVRGDIDVCFTSVDSFVLAASQGVDAVAFLMTDESHGADGIVAKSAIQRVSDLKGKKVAANLGWPGHFFLLYNLRNAGLPPDAVPITNLDADKAGAAFVSGSLDAAVTWEPWLSKAKSEGGGHILVSTATLEGVIVDVGLVRRETMTTRGADVQAFLDGYYRALDLYGADQKGAIEVMAPALGLPAADFAGMTGTFRFIKADDARRALTPGDGSVRKLFDQAATIWQDAKVVDKPVTCQDCVTNRFVVAHLGH